MVSIAPSRLQNPSQLPLTTNPGPDGVPEELDDDELLLEELLLDELELLPDELELEELLLEELLDEDHTPDGMSVAEPPHPQAIRTNVNGIA